MVLDIRKSSAVGSTGLESPGIGIVSRYRLPYSAGKWHQWRACEIERVIFEQQKTPPLPMGLIVRLLEVASLVCVVGLAKASGKLSLA